MILPLSIWPEDEPTRPERTERGNKNCKDNKQE